MSRTALGPVKYTKGAYLHGYVLGVMKVLVLRVNYIDYKVV